MLRKDFMWQPNETELQQVISLLVDSLSPDNQIQKSVCERLCEYEKFPQFYRYLLYIITKRKENLDARTIYMALTILKNNLKILYKSFQPHIRDEIKSFLFELLQDTDQNIHKFTGNIIADISADHFDYLLEIFPKLVEFVRNNDANAVPFLKILEQLCEEISDTIEPAPTTIISQILSFLLPLLQNSTHEKKYYVFRCIDKFIVLHSNEIFNDSFQILPLLINSLKSHDTRLSTLIHSMIVTIIDVSFDKLAPHLDNIIPMIIDSTTPALYSVAVQACEVWIGLLERSESKTILKKYLSILVKILLPCLAYTDNDSFYRSCSGNDESIDDDTENIDPSRSKRETSEDVDSGSLYNPNEWTLRKCSAYALDLLSQVYEGEICSHLSQIDILLLSQKWEEQEAAILAIGAIANGCENCCSFYFPHLFSHLINCLNHKEALIRSISCWTVSRYSSFYSQNHDSYIEKVVSCVSERMLDSNKLTQGSAISCFLNLSESCGNKLSQYTDIICQKILVCMSVYKSNVLKQLYDSLGPFAKYLPGFSTNNIFTTQILPIMIYRIAVEKREFTICDLALIDSISYLSFFFKERFLPFTENLICFCVSTIEQGINQIIASEQDPSIDGPDTDYIAACLDLLASLVEHVGFPIKQLLIKYNVSNVLGRSCMCSEKDIRISVFLVIGLVAQLFIDVLQPNIDTFITLLLDFKESDSVDVISNSFWAIKYFIQKLGPESSKYIPYFMDHVFLLLSSLQLNKQTLENLVCNFSYFTKYCPTQMRAYLPNTVHFWCSCLKGLRDSTIKNEVCINLCCLLSEDPATFVNHSNLIFEGFASFRQVDDSVKSNFSQLMTKLSNQIEQNDWQKITSQMSVVLKNKLNILYGL